MSRAREHEPRPTSIGRKSSKTIRGEAVWPPHLEAAFFEGLEAYKPPQSREAIYLGRFPFRNRWISDFIFDKTGERRDHKQVGSRLQQLKDTVEGRKFLQKVTSNYGLDAPPGSKFLTRTPDDYCDRQAPPPLNLEGSNHVRPRSPTTSSSGTTPSPTFGSMLTPTVVYIDILPGTSAQLQAANSSHAGRLEPPRTPISPHSPTMPPPDRWLPTVRPIHLIDPTVVFTSPITIFATSTCSVILNGTCVHTESTPLALISDGAPGLDGHLLYGAKLVPSFWQKLCSSSDPTLYRIHQDIVPTPNPAEERANRIYSPPLSSTIYEFRYNNAACSLGAHMPNSHSPTSPTFPPYTQYSGEMQRSNSSSTDASNGSTSTELLYFADFVGDGSLLDSPHSSEHSQYGSSSANRPKMVHL